MNFVSNVWANLFRIMPYPVRLLMNFAVLPLVLAYWLPKLVISGWREGTRQVINSKDVRDRLLIDDISFDEPEFIDAIDQAAAMSEAEDWEGLQRLVEEWEKTTKSTSGGQHFYRAALIGGRLPQYRALSELGDDYEIIPLSKIDTSTFERLENALVTRPDDPVLAAITARAAIEIGWVLRGSGFVDEISSVQMNGMTTYFDKAAQILAPFDLEECKWAVLLLVQHQLADGLADGGKHLRKSYEAWRKSVPTDVYLYSEHAFKLLPRWFGDYEELEVTARQAAADTQDILGCGAYAAFFLGVLECDDGALHSVETELFEEGCNDLILASGGNQRRVNMILSILADAGSEYVGEETRSVERRSELRTIFHNIVRQHLKCFCKDAWQMRPMEAKTLIAEVFQEDIIDGKTIQLSKDGVVVS